MANKQLVDYVRGQLTQRASVEQIRTLLLQQGWLPQDVEAAIMEARQQSQVQTHKEHHSHFLVTAIAVIIILGLIFALFVVVFKKTNEPSFIEDEEPILLPPKNLPVEEKKDPDWYTCRELIDYSAKHACYYDLNFANTTYNCETITNAEEKNACYRGKDQVLLEKYSQTNDPVVQIEME